MNDFEKTSWLASRCMGNILFINHETENITYDDIEDELGYYDLDFVNIFKESGHMAWLLKEKPKQLSTFTIDDGWGIVGGGWECPYCENAHSFVYVYAGEEYDCEKCNETSIAKYNSEY